MEYESNPILDHTAFRMKYHNDRKLHNQDPLSFKLITGTKIRGKKIMAKSI